MKIALVHNPTAGGGHDVDDLVKLLTDAGHEVRHRSSKGDWESLLQDSGDLVVAAGGDGTVRKVALAAADHGLPFAVLPIGTANNIGKDREPMLAYLGSRLNLASGEMPPLRTTRAAHVELVAPAGVRLHVDDTLWPSGDVLAEPTRLKVRCEPGAVTLLG